MKNSTEIPDARLTQGIWLDIRLENACNHGYCTVKGKNFQGKKTMNPKPDLDADTPSWGIFSAICLDSYNNNPDSSIGTGNFIRFYSSQSVALNGYWGAVYVSGAFLDGHIEAIVVHRGTVISDILDLANDVELFLNIGVSQIPTAREFSSQCVDLLIDAYKIPGESREEFISRNKIWHTGHSLGAILSDAVSALDFKTGSCTIENPGSRDILEKYFNLKDTPAGHGGFTTLQNLPNFINTIKRQMGTVFQILYGVFNFDFITAELIMQPKSISDNVFTNLWYIPYTFKNHAIENIYNGFHSGLQHKFPEYGMMTWYPTGLRDGYKMLLDTIHFTEFWGILFQNIWGVNHHGQQEKDFIRDCMNHIDEISRRGMVNITNPARIGKKELLSLHHSPFGQNKNGFFYRGETLVIDVDGDDFESQETLQKVSTMDITRGNKCLMQ